MEELHPQLFDGFAAAARSLQRAETEEDYAQAALSGRRLLEKTADYLFPPGEELRKGRKVGKAEYKNRLWAYIEETIAISPGAPDDALTSLGGEAERLIKLFNSGLHAHPTRQRVEEAFVALVMWLSEVIRISPAAARRLYLAYEEQLRMFFDLV